IGLLLILLTLSGSYFRWRKTIFEKRWIMRTFIFAVIGPFIANQAGWVAAEVGRQPWIVYKLLRTTDAVSKALVPDQILASIIMFGIIYLLLFAVWIYVLNDKIQHGPEDIMEVPPSTSAASLLESAARLANPSGFSLTTAHDPVPPEET